MLSLSNARNGFLLVDEIENGLHHTVLADVWRTVFRVARKLNVQVFATTHSWNCIEAFQIAAAKAPEEGVLLKLSVKNDNIIPSIFREDELAIATRDQIELR
jgi:AAA15 family ATPase/GTPase